MPKTGIQAMVNRSKTSEMSYCVRWEVRISNKPMNEKQVTQTIIPMGLTSSKISPMKLAKTLMKNPCCPERSSRLDIPEFLLLEYLVYKGKIRSTVNSS